jgi:hypothetical protein
VGSGRHLQQQSSLLSQQQGAAAAAATVAAAAAALGPAASSHRLQPSQRSFPGGVVGGAFTPHQTVRFEEAGGVGGLFGGAFDCTMVTLTLRGLRPAEDPFGWLKKRWDEQISTAEELGMTVPPTMEVPVPPLQPVIYHIEMTDVEGACGGGRSCGGRADGLVGSGRMGASSGAVWLLLGTSGRPMSGGPPGRCVDATSTLWDPHAGDVHSFRP